MAFRTVQSVQGGSTIPMIASLFGSSFMPVLKPGGACVSYDLDQQGDLWLSERIKIFAVSTYIACA